MGPEARLREARRIAGPAAGAPLDIAGDLAFQREEMRLGRLRVPVLVAHGQEDSIASVRPSRLLARELKRRDLPRRTFHRPLAGHGSCATGERLAFYLTLQAFLAENLASRAPAAKP